MNNDPLGNYISALSLIATASQEFYNTNYEKQLQCILEAKRELDNALKTIKNMPKIYIVK